MFTPSVNAPFINKAFTPIRINLMHASMKRLLDFAKAATDGSDDPVTDFASLGARMGATSAVLTNWKARGVSKEGAIKSEALFGCAANWVLTGEGPRRAEKIRRDFVAADLFRDSASLREFARLQVKSREDLSPEKQAEYLAALDSLESEAKGKRH